MPTPRQQAEGDRLARVWSVRKLLSSLPTPPPSIPSWLAIALLAGAAAPAVAFGVGGVPHTGRVGLAAGGLSSLATVATKLMSGQPPYTPGFHGSVPFIYPPGMLIFIPAPLLAGPGRYVLAFAVEMLIVLLVGVALVRAYHASSDPRADALGWSLLAVLAAAGPLTLYRTDPVIGLLLVAAAIAWRRGSVGTSFLLVLAAGLIKEYAWVEVVPLLGWQVGATVRGRPSSLRLASATVRPVLLAGVPILVILAAVEVWSHGGLVASQLHNLDRGVEIESLPAAVAMLLAGLRGVIVVRGALGSMQIAGSGLHLRLISTAFAAAGVGLLALIAIRSARPPILPGTAFSFAMGLALLVTPVLSPQYLDALTPCLCLAALEARPSIRAYLLWGTLGLALLTQLEFPYLWTSVLSLSAHGLVALELRNLALVAIVATIGTVWMRSGAPGARTAVLPTTSNSH